FKGSAACKNSFSTLLISVNPVPLTQRGESASSSNKFAQTDKLLEEPYNAKPFLQRR
ncbi:hypothetical protein OESDEN_18620, partial [Oesophagostomum dentatum]